MNFKSDCFVFEFARSDSDANKETNPLAVSCEHARWTTKPDSLGNLVSASASTLDIIVLHIPFYRRSFPLSLAMAACACATRLLMADSGRPLDDSAPDEVSWISAEVE